MGKQWKQCQTLFWGAPKSLQMVTAAMKLKDAYSLEGKLWKMTLYFNLHLSPPTHNSSLCLVAQLCLTLCDPLDYSPPGSSVHGIFQAGILDWVAISSSMGSSWPRDQTPISYIAGRFYTHWGIRETQSQSNHGKNIMQFLFARHSTWSELLKIVWVIKKSRKVQELSQFREA